MAFSFWRIPLPSTGSFQLLSKEFRVSGRLAATPGEIEGPVAKSFPTVTRVDHLALQLRESSGMVDLARSIRGWAQKTAETVPVCFTPSAFSDWVISIHSLCVLSDRAPHAVLARLQRSLKPLWRVCHWSQPLCKNPKCLSVRGKIGMFPRQNTQPAPNESNTARRLSFNGKNTQQLGR